MLRLLALLGVAVAAWGAWWDRQLPEPAALRAELHDEPRQTATLRAAFTTTSGGIEYSVKPLFDYEIQGLVVSRYDTSSWWGWIHKATNDVLNVADLCVVWGDNARSGIYRDIAFSSGQWTCNFSTSSSEAFARFNQSQISNNHLLTDNAALARRIRQFREGDQVMIRGQLAEYRHQVGMDFFRGTSTVRNDGGNGACETVFVTDAQLLQSAPAWPRMLFYGGAVLMVLAAVIGFMRPHRARD